MKSITHLLKKEFDKRKAKNASYTLRAFAKSLDIDHSQLSKIMRGERSPGKTFIEKVGKRLDLSAEDIKLLQKQKSSVKKINYYPITDQVFEATANYKYDILVELIKTSDFRNDFDWLAKRVGCSKEEVKHLTKVLLDLDLISISPEGEWEDLTSGFSLHIPSKTESKAKKNYHKELLQVAIESIDLPEKRRVHSRMIMATNEKKIAAANEMISKFRDKLVSFLEDCDDKDTVYCLHTSLFPLVD